MGIPQKILAPLSVATVLCTASPAIGQGPPLAPRAAVQRMVDSRGLDGMMPEAAGIELTAWALHTGQTRDALRGDIAEWARSAATQSDSGLVALYQERFADAARALSVAVDASSPPRSDDLLNLIRAQIAVGDVTGATGTAERALELPASGPRKLIAYGGVLSLAAQFGLAERILTRAVQDAGEGTSDWTELVAALTELGNLLAIQARYNDAEALYARAVAVTDSVGGAADLRIAPLSLGRGEFLLAQGKFTGDTSQVGAMEAFGRAERLLTPHADEFPLTLARARSGLAAVYAVMGKIDSMSVAQSRIITDLESHTDADLAPLAKAALLTDLASMYFATSRDSVAEAALVSARAELDSAGLGLHPMTDGVTERLAAFYTSVDRLDEAEALYRAQLGARETALCGIAPVAEEGVSDVDDRGPRALTATCREAHPGLAQTRNSLAVVLETEGDREGADSLYQQALAGLQQSVGYNHPSTLRVHENFVRNQRSLSWGRRGWEFNAGIGSLNDFPEEYSPTPDGADDQLRRDALQAVRGGYAFANGLFVQAEAANSLMRVADRNEVRRNLNIFLLGASAGYNIQIARGIQLFPVIGAGWARVTPDVAPSETDIQLNGGIGARFFVTPNIAIRLDGRVHWVSDPMRDFRSLLDSIPQTVNLYLGQMSVGISYFHGGPFDSDQDGVRNARDHCPDTPVARSVDARGCSADQDNDGIRDWRDRCPGTKLGVVVNEVGCPQDPDHDGVPSGLDRCEDTAPGADVDARGCEPALALQDLFQRSDEVPHVALAGAVAHQPDAPGFPLEGAEPAHDLDAVVRQ